MPTSTFNHLNDSKKQRVLAALNLELSVHPLQTAQVARIIKTAAIPRGSFYKYFTDLQDAYDYLYQTSIATIHDPFRQLDLHNPQQLTKFIESMKGYIAQMQASPYYDFFKMHFSHNESTFASAKPVENRPLTDPVLWSIATLSHATIKEIMVDDTHQALAIKRLQSAIRYYIKEAN